MHNPPHPGALIRDDILPELGISISTAAKQLGISRITLSRILNGKAGISAEMATRLHLWLGEDSPSAASWLRHQAEYELWHIAQQCRPAVTPAQLKHA